MNSNYGESLPLSPSFFFQVFKRQSLEKENIWIELLSCLIYKWTIFTEGGTMAFAHKQFIIQSDMHYFWYNEKN